MEDNFPPPLPNFSQSLLKRAATMPVNKACSVIFPVTNPKDEACTSDGLGLLFHGGYHCWVRTEEYEINE
ncbi:uncharacterized protein G2W53_027726 [Senna tora]|uniref:Uncharacterized protein n=1 Tax=Senna tora TaxID=362788 RepID=A0A834TJJ0_9FABA|nr:uncharacterized protein G2W53_027726 [Senna tora]